MYLQVDGGGPLTHETYAGQHILVGVFSWADSCQQGVSRNNISSLSIAEAEF